MTTEEKIFDLQAKYAPAGDQVEAIAQVSNWIADGVRDMTIHGITGSGKTFTMANIIAASNRPAIIYSPNKILAYQLYEEFKTFFPNNEVHYYVSTFDMYVPEYVKYGEFHSKRSSTNEMLAQMALDTQTALASGKRDVIIVTSSSCLFGTGSPKMYKNSSISLSIKEPLTRDEIISKLLHAGYQEFLDDDVPRRGSIQIQKRSLKIISNIFDNRIIQWDLRFDPEEYLSKINLYIIDETTGEYIERNTNMNTGHIFPATRHVQDVYDATELDLISENMLWEAKQQRNLLKPDAYDLLVNRIEDDLDDIRATGYCNGIENYAWYFNRDNLHRHYDPADYETMSPYTLFSYLDPDTLMFIDESHLALGQIEGAARADFTRKAELVKEGIRLPSCVINRPLKKYEVREQNLQTIYVSATPREEELNLSGDHVTKLWIRPTWLLDPEIETVFVEDLEAKGTSYREHVVREVLEVKKRGGAVLLRCPDAKICRYYYQELLQRGVKAAVMLAETPAIERRELVERLQGSNPELAPLDVIIGVNLIREGLDIPRVEKVLITYADVGGFLNDTTSLIQVIGRAARNANGKVVMYMQNEKRMTQHIKDAIKQTEERRAIQMAYNEKHGKTPVTAVANSYLNNIMAEAYNIEDDLFRDEEDLGVDVAYAYLQAEEKRARERAVENAQKQHAQEILRAELEAEERRKAYAELGMTESTSDTLKDSILDTLIPDVPEVASPTTKARTKRRSRKSAEAEAATTEAVTEAVTEATTATETPTPTKTRTKTGRSSTRATRAKGSAELEQVQAEVNIPTTEPSSLEEEATPTSRTKVRQKKPTRSRAKKTSTDEDA